MVQEFIKFVKETNAMALAIGVIIAGAVGKVVDGLVNNIINPIIGLALGGLNLSNALMIPLGTTVNEKGERIVNAIKIGDMISILINFIIILWVIFLIAKRFTPDAVKPK
jgi:large conductance mechanosensitive channel